MRSEPSQIFDVVADAGELHFEKRAVQLAFEVVEGVARHRFSAIIGNRLSQIEFESGGSRVNRDSRHLHVERRHVLDEARLVHVEVDARHAIGVGVGLGVFPEDVVVVENEPVVFEDGDRVVALYELVGGVVVVAGGQCEGREGQKEKLFHRSLL